MQSLGSSSTALWIPPTTRFRPCGRSAESVVLTPTSWACPAKSHQRLWLQGSPLWTPCGPRRPFATPFFERSPRRPRGRPGRKLSPPPRTAAITELPATGERLIPTAPTQLTRCFSGPCSAVLPREEKGKGAKGAKQRSRFGLSTPSRLSASRLPASHPRRSTPRALDLP